jgi:hypothetical protein
VGNLFPFCGVELHNKRKLLAHSRCSALARTNNLSDCKFLILIIKKLNRNTYRFMGIKLAQTIIAEKEETYVVEKKATGFPLKKAAQVTDDKDGASAQSRED